MSSAKQIPTPLAEKQQTSNSIREHDEPSKNKVSSFFFQLKHLFSLGKVASTTTKRPFKIIDCKQKSQLESEACFQGQKPTFSCESFHLDGKELGQGSFSKVLLATCLENGQKVALKVLMEEDATSKNWKAFEREIQVLASISIPGHQNVLRYLGSARTSDGRIAIATEFLPEAQELYVRVVQAGRLSQEESRGIFKQLILGVGFLHEKGVVHRDLKLENVMLIPKGHSEEGIALWEVKIVDFGLARFFLPGELLGTRCGSEEYAAPEVIKGLPYNPQASDIWSLGVILYAMIVGFLPFQGGNSYGVRKEQLYGSICSGIVKFPVTCGDEFGEVKCLIGKMLEIEPRKRPNLQEILSDEWLLVSEKKTEEQKMQRNERE